MELKDTLSIVAILISPLVAVQTEKYIERIRSSRNRKVLIFKTLMATRGNRLSLEHVTALNQVDLEFYGNKKYQKVLNAWKEYFDQLSIHVDRPEELKAWTLKGEELLANLLYEMGASLGYSFDKVTIKRNGYSPRAHEDTERENQQIRNLLIQVLKGEKAITTLQVAPDEIAKLNSAAQAKTGELQDLLIDQYKKQKPTIVKIMKEE